ncbi:MAG: glycoside hydrolase family 172 protein [Planctomycetota bacterium]
MRSDAPDIAREPYRLGGGLSSRSISFENPTGAPGAGGREASPLGAGRKGRPMTWLDPGAEVELCDVAGPGTFRHVWITTPPSQRNLRSLVVRGWWEGQAHPSIEAPLGDFMGFAHGRVVAYQSAVHSVGEKAGLNLWLPMPFVRRARFAIANEGEQRVALFYQMDYTVGDEHGADVGRLHVLFRRENPTTERRDFELLPRRVGQGRYLGAVIGVRDLHNRWWGEGELKVYLDGDSELPTICGTGSEDYVGLSWGVQPTPFLHHGASLVQGEYTSMYRWHLLDPIWWRREVRVTIQQIAWADGLAETADDWSCATFWYEPVPSAPLPPLPGVAARTAAL